MHDQNRIIGKVLKSVEQYGTSNKFSISVGTKLHKEEVIESVIVISDLKGKNGVPNRQLYTTRSMK